MQNLGFLGWIAWILVIIGGIDCGFYGIFHFHLLEIILGAQLVGRAFFVLIGIGAGYLIYLPIKKKTQA
ncbi:MAG: hypothetical protein ACD_45C00292G0012 [uncultured bacterium]|nr:MAG: hypothetical protein ACD_45C00292G0012 [uncultured bacterium]